MNASEYGVEGNGGYIYKYGFRNISKKNSDVLTVDVVIAANGAKCAQIDYRG